MTGMELLTELTKMGDAELSYPVVLESGGTISPVRACRGVIFDPEMREIVLRVKGPFE